MRKICKVRANGEEFSANCGDLLLDAALMNGIDIPYDCRSGYCGTCRVNLVGGRVFGGAEEGLPNVVRACQCRVISDVSIEGFYKYSDETIVSLPEEDMMEFD